MIEQGSSEKQVTFFKNMSKCVIAFLKSTLSIENQFRYPNEQEAQYDWECNTELQFINSSSM